MSKVHPRFLIFYTFNSLILRTYHFSTYFNAEIVTGTVENKSYDNDSERDDGGENEDGEGEEIFLGGRTPGPFLTDIDLNGNPVRTVQFLVAILLYVFFSFFLFSFLFFLFFYFIVSSNLCGRNFILFKLIFFS